MKHSAIIGLATAMLVSYSALADSDLPSVVSGGVSDEDMTNIEEIQHNYNTKLVFTGDRGMYLSGVEVSIRNHNGDEVVSNVTDGPILLTKLEPGRYTVQAKTEGFIKKRTIQVGTVTKTYNIQFPVVDKSSSKQIGMLNSDGYEVSMYFLG